MSLISELKLLILVWAISSSFVTFECSRRSNRFDVTDYAPESTGKFNQQNDDKRLYNYTQSLTWSLQARKNFGQITAVDVNEKGNIVIFHRGDHVWNGDSFDQSNIYKHQNSDPIGVTTIIEIDPSNEQIVSIQHY